MSSLYNFEIKDISLRIVDHTINLQLKNKNKNIIIPTSDYNKFSKEIIALISQYKEYILNEPEPYEGSYNIIIIAKHAANIL